MKYIVHITQKGKIDDTVFSDRAAAYRFATAVRISTGIRPQCIEIIAMNNSQYAAYVAEKETLGKHELDPTAGEGEI